MSRKVINVMIALSVVVVFGMTGCGGGGTSGTETQNTVPVASAGTTQSIVAGAIVTLDGSASTDPNGDTLTYSWTVTSKPSRSSAELSSATLAKPTFTPDVAGVYVFNLVVNDGKVSSAAATVTINVSVANVAPVARAGTAQNVITGAVVTLDCSASSDVSNDPLTYSWAFASKPIGSNAALSSATVIKPTFTPDVVGEYVLNLVVNDGMANSALATVTVTSTSTSTGTGDSSPPQLKSFTISPATIDTSSQSQSVTLNLRLTDNLSGVAVNNIWLSFSNPSDGSVITGHPLLVSGNNLDGNYSCSLQVPKYAPQGTWHLYYIGTSDNATNNMNLYENDAIALGYQTTFQNTGTGDSSPPQLKSFTISPAIIDTSSQSQSVTLDLRLTDNLSGVAVNNIWLSFSNPSDGSVITGHPLLVSGNNLDGNYSCSLQVPRYAPQGTWHLYYIGTSDNATNNMNLYKNDVITLGYQTTFQNISQ